MWHKSGFVVQTESTEVSILKFGLGGLSLVLSGHVKAIKQMWSTFLSPAILYYVLLHCSSATSQRLRSRRTSSKKSIRFCLTPGDFWVNYNRNIVEAPISTGTPTPRETASPGEITLRESRMMMHRFHSQHWLPRDWVKLWWVLLAAGWDTDSELETFATQPTAFHDWVFRWAPQNVWSPFSTLIDRKGLKLFLGFLLSREVEFIDPSNREQNQVTVVR